MFFFRDGIVHLSIVSWFAEIPRFLASAIPARNNSDAGKDKSKARRRRVPASPVGFLRDVGVSGWNVHRLNVWREMLEKSSRHVYAYIPFKKTKILTRTCFCLDFEWINSKWTVSRLLNDHSFPKLGKILQMCLSQWTVTPVIPKTSKNTTGTLLIYTTPKWMGGSPC